MSYKLDLSGLGTSGHGVDHPAARGPHLGRDRERRAGAGRQAPAHARAGRQAGVNHLTAARVYRKLAELGYVSASVGRGTFVRTLAPASSASHGDDWQVYALPPDEVTYSEQILADTFALAGRDDVISLATGWPAPSTYPTEELARIAAEVFAEEGGDALSYLPAEGLFELREQIAARGRGLRLRRGRRRGRDHLRRPAGDRAVRAGHARAGRRRRDRVADLHRDDDRAARHARARDRRARGRGRLRRRRPRAPAGPARGQAGRAADAPARTRPAATSPRSAAPGWPSWPWSATSSSSRTASTPTCTSRGASCARCASSPPHTCST